MEAFLAQLHPLLLYVLRALIWVVPLLLGVAFLVWWERRVLAWFQDRIGPNRVGPFGLLQPFVDITKLILKEDLRPKGADKLLYLLAPILSLIPTLLMGAVIPFAPAIGVYAYLTPISDLGLGVLYILAASSLGSYGNVLAGYASGNKYSLLGGLRGSAQLISYELAMTVSLACLVLASGTLKISEIIAYQSGSLWGMVPYIHNWFCFTPYGLVSAVIFFICMIAETNRAPFDLPEAENELVAGYHTEYSSARFAVFYMNEYAAILVFSSIFNTLFLGGYHLLPFNWEKIGSVFSFLEGVCYFMKNTEIMLAPFIFAGKTFCVATLFIWCRATFPRLRYDQLMSIGWKALLPGAVSNFVLVALWVLFTQLYGFWGGWFIFFMAAGILIMLFKIISKQSFDEKNMIERRQVKWVNSEGNTQ